MKIIEFFKNCFKRKTEHIEVEYRPKGYDPKLALSVLILAKSFYENKSTFIRSGMCAYMYRAYLERTKKYPSITDLITLIPEFNYKFLGGKNGYYWWDIEDSKSRLKAFDKLIEIYST